VPEVVAPGAAAVAVGDAAAVGGDAVGDSAIDRFKKRKIEEARVHVSAYADTGFVPAVSVAAESAFVFSTGFFADNRRAMRPVLAEQLVMLNHNASFWTQNVRILHDALAVPDAASDHEVDNAAAADEE